MGIEGLTSHLLEAVASYPVLTFALLLATLSSTCWYIRDSSKVDAFSLKHVLITGCDSGFGNLLARRLDLQGFHVIAACLTQKGSADLACSTSPRLKTLLLDVTDSESIRRAQHFVSREVGERGLWGLVNNAGRSTPIGPCDWMRLEDFTKVLDVNLLGVIEVTLQFLPLLKKARGRVVNMASVLGRLGIIGGGYCPSKWGVEAFSDSLRVAGACWSLSQLIRATGGVHPGLVERDMQQFGVKVSIIEPGFFKTNLTQLDLIEADLRRLWTRLPQEVKSSYGVTYFADYLKAQDLSMRILCSPHIAMVTRCMEQALTARFPHTRYSAGWDAKLLWIPLSYLPSCVSDFAVSFFLPAPAAAP
ncbi:retinol dehydrogenase 1 isoform X1 [Dunckerocampus dactyliophorus]|uniref:retinol dehydrogenase 1 isoform X1 n=1 Tax=Dunckerocampus dactyliophorus TaxID=161453 RepID=UPI0024058ACB|nr:retinol dehydrogenase 1 isoform X1 [Dunckerocampus dactyliophorus]